jgi:hypothetical protein
MLLLAVGVGAPQQAAACGAKYLNIGLGTHYHRSAAERRAALVLLYANPGSELSRLLTALTVEEAMNKAGYRPTIASSTTELAAALAQKWDVIVVDGREAQAVAQRLQKPAGTHVVPVLTRPTKDELRLAEKTYETVLNTPSKNRVFVDVVDDAMDLHEIEVKAAAKAAKGSAR